MRNWRYAVASGRIPGRRPGRTRSHLRHTNPACPFLKPKRVGIESVAHTFEQAKSLGKTRSSCTGTKLRSPHIKGLALGVERDPIER